MYRNSQNFICIQFAICVSLISPGYPRCSIALQCRIVTYSIIHLCCTQIFIFYYILSQYFFRSTTNPTYPSSSLSSLPLLPLPLHPIPLSFSLFLSLSFFLSPSFSLFLSLLRDTQRYRERIYISLPIYLYLSLISHYTLGATVAQWLRAGLQVNMSNEQSCTWGMFLYKIPHYPKFSFVQYCLTVQTRGLKHPHFISFCASSEISNLLISVTRITIFMSQALDA